MLAWPLFMSAIVVTPSVWGFATGEWRAARQGTRSVIIGGMLVLIAGFGVLAWSGADFFGDTLFTLEHAFVRPPDLSNPDCRGEIGGCNLPEEEPLNHTLESIRDLCARSRS